MFYNKFSKMLPKYDIRHPWEGVLPQYLPGKKDAYRGTKGPKPPRNLTVNIVWRLHRTQTNPGGFGFLLIPLVV